MSKLSAFAVAGECRRKDRSIPVTAHYSGGTLIHIDCDHADCVYVSRCKLYDELQRHAYQLDE